MHEEAVDLHDKFLLLETRSFHSTFEYFCHNQPGTRVFKSLLDSQWRICSLCRSRRILICSLSELWRGISLTFGICESNCSTTGLTCSRTDRRRLTGRPFPVRLRSYCVRCLRRSGLLRRVRVMLRKARRCGQSSVARHHCAERSELLYLSVAIWWL